MKSISHGTVSSRIRSAMKKTAPLSTPTSSRSRPSYSREISCAELGDPRLQHVLLDQDLADRFLDLYSPPLTAPSQPGASAIPGHRDHLRPAHDERPVVPLALSAPSRPRTDPAPSCAGLRADLPAGAYAPRARAGPTRSSTAPTARCPRAGACRTRGRRGRRRRGRRTSSRRASTSRSASVRSSVRGSLGRSSASESSEARARGSSRSSSGRISARMRPRFVSGFDESSRKRSPRSSQ